MIPAKTANVSVGPRVTPTGAGELHVDLPMTDNTMKCPICLHADHAHFIKGQQGNFTRFQCGRCKDFVISINALPRLATNPARGQQFAETSAKLPTDTLLVIRVPNPVPGQQGPDDALRVSEEPTTNWE